MFRAYSLTTGRWGPVPVKSEDTASAFRSHQESIINLHHHVRHAVFEPTDTTVAEEQRRTQSQLHPRQLKVHVNASRCSQQRERAVFWLSLMVGLSMPAVAVEAASTLSYNTRSRYPCAMHSPMGIREQPFIPMQRESLRTHHCAPGIRVRQTSTPLSGTTRGTAPGAAPWRRSVSLITLSRAPPPSAHSLPDRNSALPHLLPVPSGDWKTPAPPRPGMSA